MIRRVTSLSIAAVCLVLSFAAVSAAPQQKIQLARKAKVGDVSRTVTEATMSATMNGNAMSMGVKEVEKATITAVAGDGAITLTAQAESSEVTMMGQTMPGPPQQDPFTIVIRPDNSLVSHSRNDPQKMDARMNAATHVLFSDKPVGAGDSWTREIKEGAGPGVAATGDYKLVAFEKAGTVDAAKITFTFRELGADGIVVSGTIWVETATGEEVKGEYEVKNLPLSPGVSGTATVKTSRMAAGS